jgi:hypothetical protein
MYTIAVIHVSKGIVCDVAVINSEDSAQASKAAEIKVLEWAESKLGMDELEIKECEADLRSGGFTRGNGEDDLVKFHTSDVINLSEQAAPTPVKHPEEELDSTLRNRIVDAEIANSISTMEDMPEELSKRLTRLERLREIRPRVLFRATHKIITGAEDCDLPPEIR